jgi:hypothetical protein
LPPVVKIIPVFIPYNANFDDKSTDLLAKRGHIMPIYMKIVHRWGISPSVAVFHHRWEIFISFGIND